MQDPDPAVTARTAAYFDAEAASWERDHGPASVRKAGFRAITALLEGLISDFAAPPAMLDIGCGTGAHLRALRSGLRLGVGVDLSPRMIAAAGDAAASGADRSEAPLRFVAGDAATLGEAIAAEGGETTFDLVTMIGMLEHVDDRARALAGAVAMLTPGTGRLVVITPHRYSLPLLYGRIMHGGPPPSFPMVRHFTIRGLTRLGRGAGLRLERVAPIHAPVWHEADAPRRLLRGLDWARHRLPGVRRLGTFAAIFRLAGHSGGA